MDPDFLDFSELRRVYLEEWAGRNPVLFEHLLPGAMPLTAAELNALLREAMAAGRLEPAEVVRSTRTNVIDEALDDEAPVDAAL